MAKESSFDEIVWAHLSRRAALSGSLGAALLAACSGALRGSGTGESARDAGRDPSGADSGGAQPDAGPGLTLGFESVAKGTLDTVTVPAGYSVATLYRLGDPLSADTPSFLNDGTDSAASYEKRAGDHHDGMGYFGIDANGFPDSRNSARGLLVVNHESITPAYLHPTGQSLSAGQPSQGRSVAEEVLKEMYAHGVSIVEVARDGKAWAIRPESPRNRRITSATPIDLSGPAARSAYMVTRYSPDGTRTRGTVNNCANGYTPWGTYLTCEENWAGYFRRTEADNARRTAKEKAAHARYGVAGEGRHLWATVVPDTPDAIFGRWNAERLGVAEDGGDDFRNAPNTFGWVVEIDPYSPMSGPTKRTALGRFAHEGCWLGPVRAGEPLVWYMGCDGRNEYIYKFVSERVWELADAKGGMAAGDKYLDRGTLYAAKFNADGSGEWLELRFGVGRVTRDYAPYAFADHADVLVHAVLAADAAGATPMDRPEWGAVHPQTGEVYFTLTNTNAKSRPVGRTDAANPRFYDDPKGGASQKGNPNGHIIRFAESGGRASATSFQWDVYLFGARSTADVGVNLSGLDASNDFSSPDGCSFSLAVPGLMWLQTDDAAYTDQTNCMLLAAIPGRVGDGSTRTLTNADGALRRTQETRVGATATPATLRRFLVGPRECELTGIAETPDGKTLFVNIQHPGEDTTPKYGDPTSFGSHWPAGGSARPRSATLAITRDDGGRIGTV